MTKWKNIELKIWSWVSFNISNHSLTFWFKMLRLHFAPKFQSILSLRNILKKWYIIILIIIQGHYRPFAHHCWVCGYPLTYQMATSSMDKYPLYTHYQFLMGIIHPMWMAKGEYPLNGYKFPSLYLVWSMWNAYT